MPSQSFEFSPKRYSDAQTIVLICGFLIVPVLAEDKVILRVGARLSVVSVNHGVGPLTCTSAAGARRHGVGLAGGSSRAISIMYMNNRGENPKGTVLMRSISQKSNKTLWQRFIGYVLPRLFIVNVVFSLVSGCLTNNYEEYYVEKELDRNVATPSQDTSVLVKLATTEEDVLDLLEDGYVAIGTSAFVGPYCPMSCAIDVAEKHGASLVLLDIRFKETKQYTSVMYLPSFSTTRHSGSFNTFAGGGTYSGTSTTTTMNAVPVQRDVDTYLHDAMFFRKIEASYSYGIIWQIPARLPTEKPDDQIIVRTLAVRHGSAAKRAGIKRGQIVKSINGKPVRTRNDIEFYCRNDAEIKSVEVASEK